MLDSFRIRIVSAIKLADRFFRRLLASSKSVRSKRRKPKRLPSDSGWLTSSFAAMELSSQLKQVFKFIDRNGDGAISPTEIGEVLTSLGHDEPAAAEIARGMVREMDSNGDGIVDLDEFMSIVMDPKEEEEEEEETLKEAFLVFDADGNGFISAEELQRVLIRLGCGDCSIDRCRRMISTVDKDGNGFVDFQEFKSMMCGGT